MTRPSPPTPDLPAPSGAAPGRTPRKLRAGIRRRQTITRWVVIVIVIAGALTPLYGLFDFTTRLFNGTRNWTAWTELGHLAQLNVDAPGLLSGAGTTLLLCAITAVIGVALLVPTMVWVRLRLPGMRRWIELICLLPLSIPAIVLAPGLGPVYRTIAHLLSTGAIWLCFVYVILAMPFAYRALDAGLSAIDVKTLSEAARSLGCSWGKVMWRIVLPNIRSAVLGAVFLTVALVLGEFTIAELLNKTTLPVALFNLGLNSAGNPRLTASISLVMLVLGFLLMFGFSFIGNNPKGARSTQRARVAPPVGVAAPTIPTEQAS